jgi:hypothetical protein
MNPFSVLLIDDFGDEIEMLPIHGLPYPVFLKLASINSETIFTEQASVLTEAIEFALCNKEDMKKVDNLTIDQFSKFVVRWIDDSSNHLTAEK